MIEWGSDTWGGNVHYAGNGSWVTDRHGDDSDGPEEQAPGNISSAEAAGVMVEPRPAGSQDGTAASQKFPAPTRTDSRGALRRYVRFAALGDSVTYGLGDRASQRRRGWARLLGEAIARDHDVSFCNLAYPGATATDVSTKQLGEALAHRPHLASLIVGLNDTMRSSWDPALVHTDLLDAAYQLSEQGAVLLTVRFHDHSRVFGLPAILARPIRQRIDLLNAIYDEIYEKFGGIRVDLAQHPGIYDREFWTIDRLHPSELGHRALAHEFAALLAQHGLSFDHPDLELDGDPVTRIGELRSLALEGVPWLLRRARDLGPSAGRRALRNARRVSRSMDAPARPASA